MMYCFSFFCFIYFCLCILVGFIFFCVVNQIAVCVQTGRTFLMVASEKGELNIVRELLEAGVDPNAVDNVRSRCSCVQ